MERSGSAWLLAASAAFTLLGGCIDAIAFSRDAETITVPVERGGETATFQTEAKGFMRSYSYTGSGSPKEEVKPFEDHSTVTTKVEDEVAATDAWLRPLKTVKVSTSRHDLDPEENAIADWDSFSLYETSSRLLVQQSHTIWYTMSSCTNGACSRDSGVLKGVAFPRDRDAYGWSDLNGVSLRVGDTIVREENLTFGGIQIHVKVTYDVLRAETWGTDRTFVVATKTESKVLNPPTGSLEEAEHEPQINPRTTVPEPVNLAWYSERASAPVHQFASYAFAFEGRVFYANYTADLASYAPGTDAIAWNQGPSLPPITQVAAEHAVPAKNILAQHAKVGAVSVTEAWEHIRQSPTASGFRAYVTAHPEERPAALAYLPSSPGNEKRYWMFQMGDFMNRQAGANVNGIVRQSQLPVTGTSILEDRDAPFYVNPFTKALDASNLGSLTVMGLEDARELAGGFTHATDPMIAIRFGMDSIWDTGKPVLEASFGEVGKNTMSPSIGADVGIAQMKEPVAVNLMDGGLNGINAGWMSALVYWSTVPQPTLPLAMLQIDPVTHHVSGTAASSDAERTLTLLAKRS